MEAVIGQNELQLAARNHGLPLEALRYPITPAGLHYLLIHYDIPAVNADSWRLNVDGKVERPLELTLADLRERPAHEVKATMECAGNGRALLAPHVVSQPWLLEAVGTAKWTGVSLRSILEEAEVLDDAVEVVFTGLDRGIEKGIQQSYQRSLALDSRSQALLETAERRLDAIQMQQACAEADQCLSAARVELLSAEAQFRRTRRIGCGSTRTTRGHPSPGCSRAR